MPTRQDKSLITIDWKNQTITIEDGTPPPPIDPPPEPEPPSGRITGFTYNGASRIAKRYGHCGIGGYSGQNICSDNNGNAYVVGFRSFDESGSGTPYRQPVAKIKRPMPARAVGGVLQVRDLFTWEEVDSWQHFQDPVNNATIWHPCINYNTAGIELPIYSMKNNYNVGTNEQVDIKRGDEPKTITGPGWTHNRGTEYCLPNNDTLRSLGFDYDFFMGGCICSGASTSSFGPSLYGIKGTTATPLWYYPYDNDTYKNIYALKPYKSLDIPGYPGTGYDRLEANTSRCKACIVGRYLVAIIKVALGPKLKIGGDSVAAELYEDRLMVFDIPTLFATSTSEPWKARHYLEIPVYVGNESQIYDTQFGPATMRPSDGDLILPTIDGVRDEDATQQRHWGIMYDESIDELMLVRPGVDETGGYELPPVVYHLSIERS